MPSNACTIKSILKLHTYIPGVFFLISFHIIRMTIALDVRDLGENDLQQRLCAATFLLSEEEDGKEGL